MSIHIQSAQVVPEGDGVTVKRLLPTHALRNLDPFVLWDHFDIHGGGFPTHPHRGFEAITYLFEGGMQHADNLGNQGTIHAGGAQRFTAGRGLSHSEFPDGHAHGIQLWINLPKSLKSTDPAYQQAEKMAESSEHGVTIRTIVGQGGPIQLRTEVEYLDISMAADSKLDQVIPEGWVGFVYAVQGRVNIGSESLQAGDAAMMDAIQALTLHSQSDARLMWCFGRPHGEPIYQHGPFVD